jgi:hypothetical protein
MQTENQDYRLVMLHSSRFEYLDFTYDLYSVVAADGLAKRDVFRLPDPFAVITVDSEQTQSTSAIMKTLNPYWNESFDVSVQFFLQRPVRSGNVSMINIQ